MTEEKIKNLFKENIPGETVLSITPVTGGFMHRMYRVDTPDRSYAVKHLNPNVMKRPEAMANYRKAEALESKLEKAGIAIVPALAFDSKKMQETEGDFFYIFDWVDGQITDWNNITTKQCKMAGEIQGRIHAIEHTENAEEKLEPCVINWSRYISAATAEKSETAHVLKDSEGLLDYALDEMNKAYQALPGITTIIDEDMDPKNVMWNNGVPVVIDLECLDYGNPISSALQLSLQWAGITTCDLDLQKVKAFFEGYLDAFDCGFRAYDKVFGLAYTWVEWLEYNVKRALGDCMDESERSMGVSEVINTINRIRYLYEHESQIKEVLASVF
ncbi:MAG: aminoglycoside phosphotransferase family protein [Lachnospiraceae bacterium]|nr:aminoglycoside phosphotransferase family protein [Lachnospiraceae bacterium]